MLIFPTQSGTYWYKWMRAYPASRPMKAGIGSSAPVKDKRMMDGSLYLVFWSEWKFRLSGKDGIFLFKLAAELLTLGMAVLHVCFTFVLRLIWSSSLNEWEQFHTVNLLVNRIKKKKKTPTYLESSFISDFKKAFKNIYTCNLIFVLSTVHMELSAASLVAHFRMLMSDSPTEHTESWGKICFPISLQ